MKAEKTPAILVSACLLGAACRYDGSDNEAKEIAELAQWAHLIPVCPEQLGGLATPRQPAEIKDGRVYAKDGTEVTAAFEKGAQEALKLAKRFGCRCAVLKARSPSCGSGQVYDGTFSGTKVPGDGVTAALLKKNGIRVYTEKETDLL